MQKDKAAKKELTSLDIKRIASMCGTTAQMVRMVHRGDRGVANTLLQRKVKKLLAKAYELEAQKEKILFNTLNEDAD